VTVDELARFLANPARHFFERRLGLRLAAAEGPIEGAEPFALTRLEGWAADQKAFALRRAGCNRDEVRRVLRGSGLLPDGPAGDAALDDRLADIEPIVAALAGIAFLEPVEAEVDLGLVRLAVRFEHLTPEGLVVWRVGNVRAQDRLRAWVMHLALTALAPAGVARRTRLLTRSAKLGYATAGRARDRLAELLGLMAHGECEPLPLFPEAALAFVQTLEEGEPKALAKAEKAWKDEAKDPYFALGFGDVAAPLDGHFAALSCQVFAPMCAAEESDG
jgi:exodeoxyribonuclease V gamma subunit